MEEEKKEKGFVVKDRRIFDEGGSVRTEEEKPETTKKTDGQRDNRQEAASSSEGEAVLPEPNFSNFILSLSTTAMYHFGDFPDPVTKKSHRNLQAAKQTIDLLNVLKQKTTGNLQEDEKRLLDEVLFELRMRYVKEKSK